MKTSAGVISYPKDAFLVITIEEYMMFPKVIVISGGSTDNKDQNYDVDSPMYHREDFLPNINVDNVIRSLNTPAAKHASFNKSGNCFSRIAHLVQQGYQDTKGIQPQPSGVRFRWTQKDLVKYISKWTKQSTVPFTGSGHKISEQRDQFRMRGGGHTQTTYYTFTSDTTVKVTTGEQKQKKKEGASMGTGLEPGKRGINF